MTDGCTLWLDGVPPALGGSGTEWLHCCIQHDFGLITDFGLATCVAKSGFPIMGTIMLLGLSTLGVIYHSLKSRK